MVVIQLKVTKFSCKVFNMYISLCLIITLLSVISNVNGKQSLQSMDWKEVLKMHPLYRASKRNITIKPEGYFTEMDRNPSNGRKWNFKISSWYVNGLRRWCQNNGHQYILDEDPDIMCVQHLKCEELALPREAKVEGYHDYWNPGDALESGVGIYSKVEPLAVTKGFARKEDFVDSEYDSGRLITAEYKKFYVVNACVPPSGQHLTKWSQRKRFDDELREHVCELEKKKPVILVGDLNLALDELDLAEGSRSNQNFAGYSDIERDSFSKLLKAGFVDTFRYLYPKADKMYTYWSLRTRNSRLTNNGWRLDYFVLSRKFLRNLTDSVIRNQVQGSSHCPITLFLTFT